MKNFLFLVGFIFISFNGFNQSIYDNVNLKLMLFEKFMPGIVYLKGNKVVAADLNYNSDKHQLIFVEDKQYKELTGLETIDSIVVDNISFIPIQEKIFATTNYKGLYILYDYEVAPTTTTTDHSGSHKEEVSKVSNSVTGANSLAIYKKSNNVNIFKKYWAKVDKEFVEVRQLKQLAKAYKIDKNIVINYIGQYHLNLDQEQDVIMLLEHLNKAYTR